jgi:phosphoribosylformylglycinamidine cyclo-ligase
MQPTKLYVKSVLSALHQYRGAIKAMAHITGGGLIGNLPRVCPEHLVVCLDKNSWTLPPLMKWVQAQGSIPEEEMHRVFNCGIGMAVIVDAIQAEAVAAHLTSHGETVYRIGEVRERRGSEAQTQIV